MLGYDDVGHQVDRQPEQRDRAEQHDDGRQHEHRDGTFNRKTRNTHRESPSGTLAPAVVWPISVRSAVALSLARGHHGGHHCRRRQSRHHGCHRMIARAADLSASPPAAAPPLSGAPPARTPALASRPPVPFQDRHRSRRQHLLPRARHRATAADRPSAPITEMRSPSRSASAPVVTTRVPSRIPSTTSTRSASERPVCTTWKCATSPSIRYTPRLSQMSTMALRGTVERVHVCGRP